MNPVLINYLAVLVCGIISMVVGSIWYGPLFSKLWMKQHGFTEDELKKDFNPAKTFGLAFVGHLIMALALAYLISLTNAQSISDGLRVSLSTWLGFTAATMFVNSLFSRTTLTLFFIDSGYQLVNSIIFGVILILWK
ncbi:MAG: DUF1761 domain-containing protein [Ignavibacterium album]|uniref:DUF1761 domain-containing protein n=1 Tax=Ignavibacterium album TaxID=591197 RepID=A0A7V3E7Y5_9BACT|nr:DUF1761 domain-containing protein [Ignavibacterium album]MCX8105728.1 DUF1761 domain-containing protein [Ignavibacterium album]